MTEKTDVSIVKKTDELKLDFVKPNWTKELQLVKDMTAKACDETEFKLFCYLATQYKLDPLRKEIYAVRYGNAPVNIFVSRDGLLSIAHRSGQFGSMETTCEVDSATRKPVSATCTIWRKDYDKPFRNTVYFEEYNLRQALWISKPKVMLMKVAEATCLRRAFNVSNLYVQEEFDQEQESRKEEKQ